MKIIFCVHDRKTNSWTHLTAHCLECAKRHPIHLPQGIVQGSAPRSGDEAGELNTIR
jgi:hypothetical protein